MTEDEFESRLEGIVAGVKAAAPDRPALDRQQGNVTVGLNTHVPVAAPDRPALDLDWWDKALDRTSGPYAQFYVAAGDAARIVHEVRALRAALADSEALNDPLHRDLTAAQARIEAALTLCEQAEANPPPQPPPSAQPWRPNHER